MNYEKYTSLIKDLETLAKNDSKGYERRVKALTALGYAYFIGLIGALLLIPVALIAVIIFVPSVLWLVIKVAGKLILFVLAGVAAFAGLIWSFFASFWIKIPEPEGNELNRQEAPELFRKVEEICAFLNAPRPYKILLVEDFNAAVVTMPRFGIFGKRVYLLVGLPLLQALSQQQLDAVLAHEIGHISEKHSKSAANAYRLRETWGRFIESQELEGHKFSFLYQSFLNWYFPYFNAYSFVLFRMQETRADKYAVELFGEKPLGESLINLDIKSRNLSESFWGNLLSEAARDNSPPKDVFTRMASAFRETDRSRDLLNLSNAVAVSTGYDDSHPSLAERLKSIGYWSSSKLPPLPEPVSETAAQFYLGDLEAKFSETFNDLWKIRVADDWRKHHQHLEKCKNDLKKLNEKAATEPLLENELYEKANLTLEVSGKTDAIEVFAELLRLSPDHAAGNFTYGSILLDQDDDSGIEFIEKAISNDRTLKIVGCETLYHYLRSKGRDEEAKSRILEIEYEQDAYRLAEQERAGFSEYDEFEEHQIPPEKLERICNKIKYYEEIQTAYLVRKVVKHYSEYPFHIMFFETKKKTMFQNRDMFSSSELLDLMAEYLSEFGVDHFAVMNDHAKEIENKVKVVNNAKVFQRSELLD